MDKKLYYVLGTLLSVVLVVMAFNLFSPVEIGISQKATKFTDVEVKNELLVHGVATLESDVRGRFIGTGTVASFTTNTTATAAQVCNAPAFLVTPAPAEATITLPATTTLFTDCLSAVGDKVTFTVVNLGTVSTTLIAAGSGGTLTVSASTTVQAGDTAIVEVLRDATATYRASLVNAL
jgi:hypothetical protein